MSDLANFPARPPGDSRTRRVRVAFGIALVVAFSALGSFETAMRLAGMALFVPTGKNPMLKSQARLRPLLDDLPPRGLVGYRARRPLKVGKHHELEGDSVAIVRYV